MSRKLIPIILAVFMCISVCAQNKAVKPQYINAEGYPAHVHLKWDGRNSFEYNLYRYDAARDVFALCGMTSDNEYMDFSIGKSDTGREFIYRLCPVGISPESEEARDFEVKVSVPPASDENLLDMVQKYTTLYFKELAHPVTGMARERSNDVNGDVIVTGGTGFGIMALIAGADRDYLSETEVMEIIGKMVTFLEKSERFHGAWAHRYDAESGKVFSFNQYDDGGDLVETSFLVAGLLTARQWLNENGRNTALAARCDRLWNSVEWSWYTNRGSISLYRHWSKNYGWKMDQRIKGFDEALITYILAASSKKYPVSRGLYENSYKFSEYYENYDLYYDLPIFLGMPYGGPLLVAHHSFLGLNPGLKDEKVDYFERNRNHALIHYKYAVDNPKGHRGLGRNLWGFTSSDDPVAGHSDHIPMTDAENGTVAPSAGVSSIVYTPEESVELIRHLYYDLGEELFGRYGFYDSYNPSMCEGQRVVRSYLAVNQGPQAVMIENYRSGLIWDYFMSCPEIKSGLKKLRFKVTANKK